MHVYVVYTMPHRCKLGFYTCAEWASQVVATAPLIPGWLYVYTAGDGEMSRDGLHNTHAHRSKMAAVTVSCAVTIAVANYSRFRYPLFGRTLSFLGRRTTAFCLCELGTETALFTDVPFALWLCKRLSTSLRDSAQAPGSTGRNQAGAEPYE